VLRSLPRLQRLRPKAHVVVIGNDGVSYGAKLAGGQSFKDMLLAELGNSVDWSRVHFVGHVAYRDLVNLLRLARCHIYMTVPFVISWSLLEAMALEKTIIASDVAPVRQFITPGKTGLLVDFFDPAGLADQVAEVLAHRDYYREIGERARAFIQSAYDFETVCYPQFLTLIERVLLGRSGKAAQLRPAQVMRKTTGSNALPMPEAQAEGLEEGWQDF
jgi:glycosyltransferase involved in cell wall biosynthesis